MPDVTNEIFEYLKQTKNMVSECVRLIKAAGLQNDQRYLDWEDFLNAVSVRDPNL